MILSDLAETEEVIRWVPPTITPMHAGRHSQSGNAANGMDDPTEEAERDFEQELEDAKKAGYIEGVADTENRNKANESKEREELNQLLVSLRPRLTEIDEETRKAILYFAFELGRTVIGRELEADEQYYQQLINRHCDAIGKESPPIAISLHPDDVELVSGGTTALDNNILSLLVSDPDVARGSCLIETTTSYIDAGVDTAIKRIAGELRERDVQADADQ